MADFSFQFKVVLEKHICEHFKWRRISVFWKKYCNEWRKIISLSRIGNIVRDFFFGLDTLDQGKGMEKETEMI